MQPDYLLSVAAAFISTGDSASQSVPSLTASLEGIDGDRHHGFTKRAGARERRFHAPGTPIWNSRQWSAVAEEDLAEIAVGMGLDAPVKAEWLGANLAFRGCPSFTRLPPMTRIVFPGGAVLLVYGKNLPCAWPPSIMVREGGVAPETAARFGTAALHRRGLVGWVERAGVIMTGDEARVFLPRPPSD